ncbi:hypothetical protein AC578_9304 [Pseudocercospora eumusae]|uniref:Uncharacterized protein n=1 Tax=Pseudocercospora eumusae TaxID=321146 RepID=A0A139HN71_9PEZI|nr:hypothetical protein AC578_9304 [Pseudocercospora eumusae]
MAVHRGIQSAIFYYLSCAPCADARVKKRRKREAEQSRRDRLALEQDEKNRYVHPGEASTTNPNWQSEIELGPHGRRKKKTGNSSQRGLAPSRTSNRSLQTSSVDLPQRTGSQDSRWNHKVYQREDEELWGSSSNMGGSLYAGSLKRPERVKTADNSRSTGSSYYASRNPPVNDMHPATVTKVASREDVMWMMQPLPVAEVMSGKERAPRSRSDSGGSRMSPSSTTLSRELSHRLIDRKLHAGTSSAPAMSRESSSRGSNGNGGQRHDRISEQDFAISPPRETRRPSNGLMKDDSDDSTATVIRSPDLTPTRLVPRRAASRPQLSTIFSDNDVPAGLSSSGSKSRSDENNSPRARQSSDEITHDPFARRSSIAVPEKAMTTKPAGMTQGRTVVARHKHEASEVSIRDESWYAEHFDPIEWIHKHTMHKQTVKESMRPTSLGPPSNPKTITAYSNIRPLSACILNVSKMSYMARTPSERPSTKPLKSILKKAPQLHIEEHRDAKAKPYSWSGYKGKADLKAQLLASNARQQAEEGAALAMEGAQFADSQSNLASNSPIRGRACASGHHAPVNPTETRCCGIVCCYDCIVQQAGQNGGRCPNCGLLISPHDLLVMEPAHASHGSLQPSQRDDSAEPTDGVTSYPELPETTQYPTRPAFGLQSTSGAASSTLED